MRRKGGALTWPDALEQCQATDWANEADDGDLWELWAWYRWIEARIEHLRGLGYSFDDAQFLAASGDMPEGIGSPRPALATERSSS